MFGEVAEFASETEILIYLTLGLSFVVVAY